MTTAKKGLVMYSKEIHSVHYYAQISPIHCGPANAQMARDGRPNRKKYDQGYLFGVITDFNSKAAADKDQWNTDPKGLSACLQSLSSPPIDWVQCSNADPDEVMQFVLQSMDRTNFPFPALVEDGDHWVLIVGWATDVKPTSANTPKLQHIHIFDPHDKSTCHIHISADDWFADYFSPVDFKSSWQNKYAAVGQGPM